MSAVSPQPQRCVLLEEEEYSDTWRLVFDGEKLVGYWRFVPLKIEPYEKARRGALLDRELTRKVMRSFLFGCTRSYC